MKRLAALLLLASVLSVPTVSHAGWDCFNVTVKKPAKYSVPGVKRIGVMHFHGAGGRFGESVTNGLIAQLVSDGGGMVEIITMDRTDAVLGQQGKEMNGAYDDQMVASTGKLLGADAMIFGSIDDISQVSNESGVSEIEKYRHTDGAKYLAKCPTLIRSGVLGVTFQLIKVETGQVVASDHQTFRSGPEQTVTDPDPNDSWIPPGCNTVLCRAMHPCPFGGGMHSVDQFQQSLCQTAAVEFGHDLVPYDAIVQVCWDNVIKRDDAIGMMKAGLIEEAQKALEKDAEATLASPDYVKDPHKRAAFLFDCGVTHELLGDLDGALSWYTRAVLAKPDHPDKKLMDAIARVKQLIAERAKTQEQLNH